MMINIHLRKLKKLIRTPNLYFYDYFRKKLNLKDKDRDIFFEMITESDVILHYKHPLLQVAQKFNLRSGAKTGLLDNSLLVESTNLLEVLIFLYRASVINNAGLRLYTVNGSIEIDIEKFETNSSSKIFNAFSKLSRSNNFVVEVLGEFKKNFACEFFIYDSIDDDIIFVRSEKAYIRKSKRIKFCEIYPILYPNIDNWNFKTPDPVDVVYTWVDKNDDKWKSLWDLTFPNNKANDDRFTSKGELKYSLRSVEKFMPWVRKIFIVSNCAEPDWIKDKTKIHWIDHGIILDTNELPTFNSHAIESALHKIPGLSEKFIYFNDDFFVTEPVTYYDFYDFEGRSISYLEDYGTVWDENNFDISKEYLSPSIESSRIIANLFPGYKARQLHKHVPYSLKKSTLTKIESIIQKQLDDTRKNKTRGQNDINLPSFFYHHYSLATGKAVCRNVKTLIVRPTNCKSLSTNMRMRKFKFVCFNDGDGSALDNEYAKFFHMIMRQNFGQKAGHEYT